jgi:DNA polymerase I
VRDPAVASLPYEAIWAIDFEYKAPDGERPTLHCMVGRELKSGRTIRLWDDVLRAHVLPPFRIDNSTLVVAYYASAEMTCFKALGWPMPARVLDLFTEFRRITNGAVVPCGSGLLGAMLWYRLDSMGADEKADMRALAMRGGPFTDKDKSDLLDYCEGDVDSLDRLLPRMLPDIIEPRTMTTIGAPRADRSISFGQSLYRGRYMCAVANIEWLGVPIDAATLEQLRRHWDTVKGRLISAVNARFDVFVGHTFSMARFEDYLLRTGMAWPLRPDDRLDLREATFRDMTLSHPDLRPLHELRVALSALRLNDLARISQTPIAGRAT